MPDTDMHADPTAILTDPAFEDAYLDLCRYARTRCRTTEEADCVVSDTILSLVQDVRTGKVIGNLGGYLRVVFARRHSDYLRRLYRDAQVFSDDGTLLAQVPDDHDPDAWDLSVREAEAVRRALGRLSEIYREVVYRHYMKGESVDSIAHALGVPAGTVKSRLSDGRKFMRETMEQRIDVRPSHTAEREKPCSVAENTMNDQTMHHNSVDRPAADCETRPFSELSYAPRTLSIGIWGHASDRNEPFCYRGSLLAQNILILAYEKTISIRDLSAALGTAAPFVEHEVERLVSGELLGRTPGGLVFTRMFLIDFRESFGDIPAQEALAAEIAPTVWHVLDKHTASLWADEASATREYTPKQAATFRLFLVNHLMGRLITAPEVGCATEVTPPDRPNRGRWLASGKVHAYGDKPADTTRPEHPYDGSGPVQYCLGAGDNPDAVLFDYQSLFGDGHWAYHRLPGSPGLSEMTTFYASLFSSDIKPRDARIYECVPGLIDLHILRRDETGTTQPDFPGMPFEEWERWEMALRQTYTEALPLLSPALRDLKERTAVRVPAHVDGREYYRNAHALGATVAATMRALCEQGFILNVEIGKTPVLFLLYRPAAGPES